LQLFCLNHDFGAAWNNFKSASPASKKLELELNEDQFPYWVKTIGFSSQLVATFWCKEWTTTKKQLKIAPKSVLIEASNQSPWILKIGNITTSIVENTEVFTFLTNNSAKKIYMTIQYLKHV
jgi:hypothetical protein